MVHLLIVNVKIPVIASIFFNGLLSLVTYSIIELKPTIAKVLKLHIGEKDDYLN
jgi:hypothetical protein